MAKTKKTTHGKDQTHTYILAGIAILLAYGISQGGLFGTSGAGTQAIYTTVNVDSLDLLNADKPQGSCTISSNKPTYCTGDWAKVSLVDGANTDCAVYTNMDNLGWEFWGFITTDKNGMVDKQGRLNDVGNYKIRVICENECISNLLDVDVITCVDDSDDSDSSDSDDDGVPVYCSSTWPIPESQTDCNARVGCMPGQGCVFYEETLQSVARCQCEDI